MFRLGEITTFREWTFICLLGGIIAEKTIPINPRRMAPVQQKWVTFCVHRFDVFALWRPQPILLRWLVEEDKQTSFARKKAAERITRTNPAQTITPYTYFFQYIEIKNWILHPFAAADCWFCEMAKNDFWKSFSRHFPFFFATEK